MEKQWKIIAAERCPNCGNGLEVLSECPESEDVNLEQWFVNDEEVRCVSRCGFKSCMFADGHAYVQEGNIKELQDNNN